MQADDQAGLPAEAPPIRHQQAAEAGQQDEGLDGVLHAHQWFNVRAPLVPPEGYRISGGVRSRTLSRSSPSGCRCRDALVVEHLDVAAVVLEGEAEVEAPLAQLADGPPLEVAGGRSRRPPA